MNEQDLYLKGMNDLMEAIVYYRKLPHTAVKEIFDGIIIM